MMKVVETILPVLMVMLLGFGLTRRGFLQSGFIAGLNSFVYWIALPVLIVRSLLADSLEWGGAGPIYLALVAASVATFVVGYPLARRFDLYGGDRASFLQGAYRGNLALIGLPLLLFVAGTERTDIAMTGILVLAPSILAYNVTSVLLFSRMAGGSENVSWLTSLLGLRTNPLIIATLIGFLLAVSGWDMPAFLLRFLDMVGATASPLALVCIGANMAVVRLSDNLRAPITSTLLKVALLPLIAWPLGTLFGLNGDAMLILMLYASCPTAAASVILARQMGGNEKMSSCIVALTTALSLIPLALVVWCYL